jgi:hypothetical protein
VATPLADPITLVLERSGDLVVRLENHVPAASGDGAWPRWMAPGFPWKRPPGEALLTIHRVPRADLDADSNPDEESLFELDYLDLPDADATRLDRLRPGEYEIDVVMGYGGPNEISFGSASATVVAGETTDVTIRLRDVASVISARVPLSGTLFVPPSLTTWRPYLEFTPIDVPGHGESDGVRLAFADFEPDAARPGLYRWTTSGVTPGLYSASIEPYGQQSPVDTGPDGRDDVALSLGEQAEVSVVVLSEPEGEPIRASVTWGPVWPAGWRGEESFQYVAQGSDFVAQFRCRAGEIELKAMDGRYRRCESRVTIVPGPNEITLRLSAECGFFVDCRDGDALLDLAALDAEISAFEVDGDGGLEGWGYYFEEPRVCYVVTNPGLYEIAVDSIEGYEAVPPFRIRVEAGEFTEETITLRRRD